MVRPLAGHRAVAHPLVVHREEAHRAVAHPLAVVCRAEAHRALAGHRAVVVPVVARAVPCRAEAREAAPAAWKAETLVERAMVRWQAVTQDSVTPLVAISHCPA